MKNDLSKAGFRFCMLCVFLLSSVPFAQEPSRNSLLFRELVKFENMRYDAIVDIGGISGAIRSCELIVKRSEDIIALSVQRGNAKAEQIARDALYKAQAAMKKNEENKSLAETRKAQAEKAIVSMRSQLTLKNGKTLVILQGNSGAVKCFSKRLNKMIAFDDAGVGNLEPGDEIVNSGGSHAQIGFVNGTHIDLGGGSKLTIGQSDNQSQAVGLLKGSIGAEVEKKLNELKAFVKAKFEVRLQNIVLAVRGTKFLVSVDDSAGSELVVVEGCVEVRSTHGKKNDVPLMVDAGYRVKAFKNGVISKPEKIVMAEIERWWEK